MAVVRLVEQQPPKGVFVCEDAGLVINQFSLKDKKTVKTDGNKKRCARRSSKQTEGSGSKPSTHCLGACSKRGRTHVKQSSGRGQCSRRLTMRAERALW